jgi:hypothetical protein
MFFADLKSNPDKMVSIFLNHTTNQERWHEYWEDSIFSID